MIHPTDLQSMSWPHVSKDTEDTKRASLLKMGLELANQSTSNKLPLQLRLILRSIATMIIVASNLKSQLMGAIQDLHSIHRGSFKSLLKQLKLRIPSRQSITFRPLDTDLFLAVKLG